MHSGATDPGGSAGAGGGVAHCQMRELTRLPVQPPGTPRNWRAGACVETYFAETVAPEPYRPCKDRDKQNGR